MKQVALTRTGLNWYQYSESRAVGTEEAADTEEKQDAPGSRRSPKARFRAEQFDKDFDATPKTFYVNLEAAFDGTLESLQRSRRACATTSSATSRPVSRPCATCSKKCARRCTACCKESARRNRTSRWRARRSEAAPWSKTKPASKARLPAAAVRVAAAPARRASSARPPSRWTAPTQSRASWPRRNSCAQRIPTAPRPICCCADCAGANCAPPATESTRPCWLPPPTEIRQKLKSMALECQLDRSARGRRNRHGHGMRPRLARPAALRRPRLLRAGQLLRTHPTAIVSGLRALLADYPQLPDLTMMDDTPTANSETQAWLQENVAAAPAAPAEPAQPAWNVPCTTNPRHSPECPQPPDPYELAMEAARSGRAQDGIEMLMREIGAGAQRARTFPSQGATLAALRQHRPRKHRAADSAGTGGGNRTPQAGRLGGAGPGRAAAWRCCTSVSARAATTPASGQNCTPGFAAWTRCRRSTFRDNLWRVGNPNRPSRNRCWSG